MTERERLVDRRRLHEQAERGADVDATIRTVGKNTTTTGTIAAGTICGGPWGPLLRLVSRTGAGTPSGGTITQTVRIEVQSVS